MNKHFFPKYKGILSCTLLLSCFSLLPVSADTASFSYEFSLGSRQYAGTYSGDATADIPDGSGSLTLDDGTILSGKFSNGLPDGTLRETASDGNYSTYKISDGKPYGKRNYYSKDGDLLSCDWYYNQQLVSELVSSASEPDYRELLADPNSYTQQIFQISGTVDTILNDPLNSYLLITDSSGHEFVCIYKNTILDPSSQSWLPNFSEGEAVTLYGFFSGSDKLDTTELLPAVSGFSDSQLVLKQLLDGKGFKLTPASDGSSDSTLTSETIFPNTLPQFAVFYGTAASSEEAFDGSADLTYDTISRYPYFYSTESYSATGRVCSLSVNYEAESVTMLVQETVSKKYFYATYSYGTEDFFPIIGDQLSFQAFVKGNKKLDYVINDQSTYLLLPYLRIYACEKQ